MKYVRKVKGGFMFDPPQGAIDAGVVKRKFYKDGRGYRYEVPRFIEIIEKWRKGRLSPEVLSPNSTLLEAAAFYREQRQFQTLAPNSKSNYEANLRKLEDTSAFRYGKMRIKELDVATCNKAYEEWLKSGTSSSANRTSRIISVLFNFLVSLDLLPSNPMGRVKKEKHEPETHIWTREQADQFFETAFTKYEWRNVALIVYMCYDWGQRPTDIRNLKWDNIQGRTCVLKQSKRGATVYLPISDALHEMLEDQRELYDFQELVAPYHRPSDNAIVPHTSSSMNYIFRQIREEAGLPDYLKVGALRKTAINEARDGGADAMAIQQFSGHKNLQSLNPYMKFTPEGAKNALEKRK